MLRCLLVVEGVDAEKSDECDVLQDASLFACVFVRARLTRVGLGHHDVSQLVDSRQNGSRDGEAKWVLEIARLG